MVDVDRAPNPAKARATLDGELLACDAPMLSRAAVGIAIVAGTMGSAAADPTMRFGLTSGANRQTAEGAEIGPMFAFGASAGRFVGEASYSYLSFVDPGTATHRAGVALRTDLVSWGTPRFVKTLTGEVGVSHRWGTWRVGGEMHAAARDQNEAHVGLGYQLDAKWQFNLRVGLARPDANQPTMCPPGVLCRQIEMDSPTDLIGSVMLEWMFLLGR